MPRRLLASSVLLFGALAVGCNTGGEEPTAEPESYTTTATDSRALWISDVHFDPFRTTSAAPSPSPLLEALLDTTTTPHSWRSHTEWDAVLDRFPAQTGSFSDRGQDANTKTLRDVLARAATTIPDPSLALITGDFLGHQFGNDYDKYAPVQMRTFEGYDAFVAETIAYIAASVRGAVGATAPVVATLGNNDAYCGDYDIRLDADSSNFLRKTADTILEYFLPGLPPAAQDTFRTSFANGGRYAVDVPAGGGSQILVINSIPLIETYPEQWDRVPPYDTVCGPKPPIPPGEEIDWLKRQAAGPSTAWVAMHIPPGLNCYGDQGVQSEYWDPTATYASDFAELFASTAPSGPLAGAFAAHSHMATFKLVGDPPVGFVLQAPSVSPNHNNNPTFGVLTYDPVALTITGYDVHHLDIDDGTWGSFDFAGIGGPITAASLDSVYTTLSDPATQSQFEDSYRSYAPASGPGHVGLGALASNDFACLAGVQ